MQSFGLLCVSPLAEVASPAVNASGVGAWAALLEPHTPHVGAWAASVYRGRSFGDLFSSYAAAWPGRSSSPSLASTRTTPPPSPTRRRRRRGPPPSPPGSSRSRCARAVGGAGTAPPSVRAAAVASGGVVFAYVDDWALGASVGGAARRPGACRWRAPRAPTSPAVHSPCGDAVEAPSASAAGRTFDGAINVES